MRWRVTLFLAQWLGRFIRKAVVDWRVYTVSGALIAGAVFANLNDPLWTQAGIAFGIGALLLLVSAAFTARRRLLVGDFTPTTPARGDGSAEQAQADAAGALQVDLANLLQVELSRLGSLFRVVEDRRAVSSGLGPGQALDATLSVDDLVGSLQEAVSAETKVAIGPLSIPVAPLVALAGRAVRAPRLTGSLHRDGDLLILTAQQQGRGGLSWRVTAPVAASPNGGDPKGDAADRDEADDAGTGTAGEARDATLSAMVTELALRIFTDFALGREVRWQSSKNFVDGLHRFRACLRTPKDRKANLKGAERLFLKALSEDEDFPLVYYNLGVVYTELHGLTLAAGREEEADMYISAAHVSFGSAIERDPERWETYQAFAQAQLHYGRHSSVIELCERIRELKTPSNHRARTHELRARALLARGEPGDRSEAIKYARRATTLAFRGLLRARLVRRAGPGEDEDRVPRCEELLGACARTFGACYSTQIPTAAELEQGDGFRRWRRRGVLRRAKAIFRFADRYLVNASELHFEFGQRALNRGLHDLAEKELEGATQTDPTRPTFAAALALAQSRRLRRGNRRLTEEERDKVRSRCEQALRDMAGAFFPRRDANACELVARVYDELAMDAPEGRSSVVATQLRDVAVSIGARLNEAVSGASVSAFFLEALQAVKPPWEEALSPYGVAARDARVLLIEGQSRLPGGSPEVKPNRERALDDLRAALRKAEHASALNPLSSLAWETLGDVHAELFDFRNARDAWGYALGRDPDNPELYDKIGSSHWQLAFQGRSGVSRDELEQAAGYFRHALELYGSGSFDEQVRAHYRLGKLYTALRRFTEALPHLQIVEAVDKMPPLVGWVFLGFAHLELRNFSECEHQFQRVIEEGEGLATREKDPLGPAELVGDRLDERQWPLALIRAWAHVGLAFSFAERDATLTDARQHVAHARERAGELPDLSLFPTRIFAACNDCEGVILLKRKHTELAIKRLARAVGDFPYSRSYLNLALAHEQLAREQSDASVRDDELRAARRFATHSVSLAPEPKPSEEVQQLLDRLDALAGVGN